MPVKTIALLCAVLLRPVLSAAAEPLRLTERMVIGDDLLSTPPAPLDEPRPTPGPGITPWLQAPPAPLADSWRFEIRGGTHETAGLALNRERPPFTLSLEAGRSRPEPFPRAETRFFVSLGASKMFRFCRLGGSIAAGARDRAPAAEPGPAGVVPASFPMTAALAVGATATLFPVGNLKPQISVRYEHYPDDTDNGLRLLRPALTGDISLISTVLRRTSFRLFLAFESETDYGPGSTPFMILPGFTVSHRFDGDTEVRFEIANFTAHELEILPGRVGPGTVFSLAVTRSF